MEARRVTWNQNLIKVCIYTANISEILVGFKKQTHQTWSLLFLFFFFSGIEEVTLHISESADQPNQGLKFKNMNKLLSRYLPTYCIFEAKRALICTSLRTVNAPLVPNSHCVCHKIPLPFSNGLCIPFMIHSDLPKSWSSPDDVNGPLGAFIKPTSTVSSIRSPYLCPFLIEVVLVRGVNIVQNSVILSSLHMFYILGVLRVKNKHIWAMLRKKCN